MKGPGGESRMIILKSCDGDIFEIEKEAAEISELIRDSLDEDADDGGDNIPEIEVMRVSGQCLRFIVQFMAHNHEEEMKPIETPLRGNSLEEVMTQTWYQEFVSDDNMPQEQLFQILTAANYMGIKQLLDLACLKVTFQLNGKNSEEIRQILNLPKLTPEEEERAREEHRWIFEDAAI